MVICKKENFPDVELKIMKKEKRLASLLLLTTEYKSKGGRLNLSSYFI